jgi:tetratricopeptide (TPR) repeat protein
MRASAYEMKGDFEKASADRTEAIRLRPDDPQLYIDRADTLSQSGMYDKAIADCDHVIKSDPSNVAAFLTRSLAYLRKGEDAKSREDRQRANELLAKEKAKTQSKSQGGRSK